MSQGLERIFSPEIYDMAFPFIPLLLVIVLPSAFAISVIIKVLRGRYLGDDHHN